MDPIIENSDKQLAALYRAHVDTLKDRFDAALTAAGFDAVVIGAGPETFRFLDDQTHPFKPNPHFIQWLPLTRHPESCLVYAPGQPVRAIVYRPDDYWHKPPTIPDAPWRDHFEITTIARVDDMPAQLAGLPDRTAWIGDTSQWRTRPRDDLLNPEALLNNLHYHRPNRTGYEIECIRRATNRAIPAHRAAEAAFRNGASEHEILIAFLGTCRQTENELPYPAIVATNANGAVLHYQHYERERGPQHSLLIDAACAWNGYSTDITRTHAFDDPEFSGMVTDLDEAQRTLCGQVRPGVSFADLHHEAHRSVARLLRDWGLVQRDPEELVDYGITAMFFPHGLGHFLGLQVHEAGGTLADASGTEIDRPTRFPHLRLRRTLEAGQALTIEPGIYFIDSLLTQLKQSAVAKDVDWKRIDRLRKFGGIRIEDDLIVTADGAENLTRQAFSAQPVPE